MDKIDPINEILKLQKTVISQGDSITSLFKHIERLQSEIKDLKRRIELIEENNE